MKKMIFVAFLVMLAGTSALAEMSSSNISLNVPNAQSYKSGKDVSITVNPIALLIGAGNAMVDFGVTDSMALGVGGTFLNWNNVYGAGATFRPTFYLGRPRISDSWFVSPFASATNIWIKGGSNSLWIPSVGVNFGYSFVADSGFTARLGIGIQYMVAKLPSWFGRSSTLPSIEASIGYAW